MRASKSERRQTEEALAQERAQGAFSGWINIGWRDQVGAQQVGQLLRVNAVVFVFTAVDGFVGGR